MRTGQGGPSVWAMPRFVTRDGWYRAMHGHLFDVPTLLTAVERQVCMLSAARTVGEGELAPPFRLHAGLARPLVQFYDDLQRHRRTVDAFERLTTEELEPSVDLDRGARRLLRQTRFLAATFRTYKRQLIQAGSIDEHLLREALVQTTEAGFERVVATVADHVVHSGGLWPADYDLLTRLPGLTQIDVVTTERLLTAGFRDRLFEQLPGIEEQLADTGSSRRPTLEVPTADRRYFLWRDREEELRAVVRSVKTRCRSTRATAGADRPTVAARIGVVYQRPLPYLYPARHLFDQAGVPFESHDALPLASEPYAAAVDLVCEFALSGFDRPSTVALFVSPHFSFDADTDRIRSSAAEELDRALRAVRFSGGYEELARVASAWANGNDPQTVGSRPEAILLDVAARLASELVELRGVRPANVMFGALGRFLVRYSVARGGTDGMDEREQRARLAIWQGIDDLEIAHRRLDQSPTTFTEVVSILRRWIEAQTFRPSTGSDGVNLLDLQAAVYGSFDALTLVGVVDREWPEPTGRSIFYPSSLLRPLGWPTDQDRHRAVRAAFLDLVESPRERVSVSTFSLEDDALVLPSGLLEGLDDLGLPPVPAVVDPERVVTPDHALSMGLDVPFDPETTLGAWSNTRARYRDRKELCFRGYVGPRPPSTYAVKALEEYLECPFKYFARRVLRLGDEPLAEREAASLRRGLFLHSVLETFFRDWNKRGQRAVTVSTFDKAVDRFRLIAEVEILTLPPSDRAVMRAWMLGSAAAAGLVERLLHWEVERTAELVDRSTEMRLEAEYVLAGESGPRPVTLRGVVDRVDFFSNGTFRVVDYKANRAPDWKRALQLLLYSTCLEQELTRRDGRQWRTAEVAYAAFGEPHLHKPLVRGQLERRLTEGHQRAVSVVDAIERGEYPVEPAELFGCNFCAYPTVCRKNYVGDK